MLSDMRSNNLFDPMLDKLIKHCCLTRDWTQVSDPMSDKPIEPGLFDMALDRIVQSHVGQTCWTGLFDIASDNHVWCRVGQAQYRMGFFSGAQNQVSKFLNRGVHNKDQQFFFKRREKFLDVLSECCAHIIEFFFSWVERARHPWGLLVVLIFYHKFKQEFLREKKNLKRARSDKSYREPP
jgi:hypothetical protein